MPREHRIPRNDWFVVRDGKRVLHLHSPQPNDMFWFTYVMSSIEESDATELPQGFWDAPFELEEAVTGARFRHVFTGLAPSRRLGERVAIRGVLPWAIVREAPTWWERLSQWLRWRRGG